MGGARNASFSTPFGLPVAQQLLEWEDAGGSEEAETVVIRPFNEQKPLQPTVLYAVDSSRP